MAIAFGLLAHAQYPELDWRAAEAEIMRHYQAVLRLDTTNPPGNEHLVVEYLKQVFDVEGIPSQTFALDPNRSNIVARLQGTGKKRPLLIMGHTDDVTVDASKWRFPPFSATRDGGYVYARGVQCFGIGAAIDMEDGPKGFGMHSDQERLLESELYKFVRYNYEVVVDLARAK